MQKIYFLWDSILSELFPNRCFGCKKTQYILCQNCQDEAREFRNKNHTEVLFAFSYRHQGVQNALHALKYRGKKNVARAFGETLHELLLEELSERLLFDTGGKEVLLIPIPLTKKREHERGYNQSVLLAQSLLTADQNTLLTLETGILKKIRETPTQVSQKSRRERLINLQDAFMVADPSRVDGKIIVLLDDITTTGATLHEASRVLLHAGAASIITLAVAH